MVKQTSSLRKGYLNRGLKRRLEPEAFAERAIRLGVGSKKIINNFAGVSYHSIRKIRARLKASGELPEKSWRRRRVEALILDGKLLDPKIARGCRVSNEFVRNVRHELKKAGKPTRMPGFRIPPVMLCRALIKYKFLIEATGKSINFCSPIACKETQGGEMGQRLLRNPNIYRGAKKFANGRYWRTAVEQLIQEEIDREAGVPQKVWREAIKKLYIESMPKLTKKKIEDAYRLNRIFKKRISGERWGDIAKSEGISNGKMYVDRQTLIDSVSSEMAELLSRPEKEPSNPLDKVYLETWMNFSAKPREIENAKKALRTQLERTNSIPQRNIIIMRQNALQDITNAIAAS